MVKPKNPKNYYIDPNKEILPERSNPIVLAALRQRTKPIYEGMDVKHPKKSEITKTAATLKKGQSSVEVHKKVNLVNWVQSPYKEIDNKRFEAAGRKNHAIRAALSVRKHFGFSKGSELIIELPGSELETMTEEEKRDKQKLLKEKNKDLLIAAEARDKRVQLDKKVPSFTQMCWIFGRGLLIKIFAKESETTVNKLRLVNSRRLGDPIIDIDDENAIAGIVVDDQALDITSAIYGLYNADELSPHTEGYGYSELESIADEAETLDIILTEDLKEISKAAWLASILLQIQTMGLTNAEATTRIKNIVDAVAKSGKIVGTNEEVTSQQLNLSPDFTGLMNTVEKLESIIFKTLQVPQFMVQSESAANRATAIQSATQFLNGIVADDQRWLSDILQEQWYDPFLKENLNTLKTSEGTETLEGQELPFHIRRVYNQAKASEFVDLATSVVALVNGKIWDIQKANEVLGSEEVTPRAQAEAQRIEKKMDDKFKIIGEQKMKKFENEKSAVAHFSQTSEKKDKALEILAKLMEQSNF